MKEHPPQVAPQVEDPRILLVREAPCLPLAPICWMVCPEGLPDPDVSNAASTSSSQRSCPEVDLMGRRGLYGLPCHVVPCRAMPCQLFGKIRLSGLSDAQPGRTADLSYLTMRAEGQS